MILIDTNKNGQCLVSLDGDKFRMKKCQFLIKFWLAQHTCSHRRVLCVSFEKTNFPCRNVEMSRQYRYTGIYHEMSKCRNVEMSEMSLFVTTFMTTGRQAGSTAICLARTPGCQRTPVHNRGWFIYRYLFLFSFFFFISVVDVIAWLAGLRISTID